MEIALARTSDERQTLRHAVTRGGLLDLLPVRPGADDDPAPWRRSQSSAARRAADGVSEHVEALVELETSHAQPHQFVRADLVALAHETAIGHDRHRTELHEIDTVRHGHHLAWPGREMSRDRRFENRVGRDDPIRMARNTTNGPAQRRVPHAFERGLPAGGGAELFESLRVEHEWHVASSERRAEQTGAEAVDDVSLSLARERQRPASRAHAVEQIRGRAIDHGRAATIRERKGDVRHVPHVDVRRREGIAVSIVAHRRRRHDERDVHAARGQVTDEVPHRSLQAAKAVHGHGGACDDDDAQGRGRHGA